MVNSREINTAIALSYEE